MNNRTFAVNLPDEGVTEKSFEDLYRVLDEAGLSNLKYCVLHPRAFSSWSESDKSRINSSSLESVNKFSDVNLMGEFMGINIILSSDCPTGVMWGDAYNSAVRYCNK